MAETSRLTPGQFVEGLKDLAKFRGKPFGRLNGLQQAEADHARQFVSKYRGYSALAAAGQCFVLETVEKVNTEVRPNVRLPLSEFYPQFVERISHYFRTLRAADLIAKQGYPLHGYVLLRNLFDSVVLTAAAAQGITNFYKLEGIDPARPLDKSSFRKDRKKEERRVRAMMTGEVSDLSDVTRSELARWDSLFDDETHGALLTRSQSVPWLKGESPLPFVPMLQNDIAAMHMNRYCEVSWMVHRLLPLVQPKGVPLSAGWKAKWKTLDACFNQAVATLTTTLNKPIGEAMVELVQSKFPFGADDSFWT